MNTDHTSRTAKTSNSFFRRMMCVSLGIFCLSCTQGAAAQSQIGLDEIVTTGDVPGARACEPSDWELARSEAARSAAAKRGWILPTANCRAVNLPDLKDAQIVQFVGWQKTDVLVGTTLIRPHHDGPVFIMLFLGGMVEPFNAESDKGNIAAFNLLIENYRPSDRLSDLSDLGKVYLFATGHDYKPKSVPLRNVLMANDLEGSIEKRRGERIVNLRNVPGRTFGSPTANWALTFDTANDHLQLLSATLDPSEVSKP